MDGGIPVMLVWFVIIPLAGGVFAWIAGRWSARAVRWISLATMALELLFVLSLWRESAALVDLGAHPPWFGMLRRDWIPELGAGFHLAVDGMSLLLLALTAFLGMVAVGLDIRDVVHDVHQAG